MIGLCAMDDTKSSNSQLIFSPKFLHDYLTQRLSLPRGARIAVAFSGGRDSRALLHALSSLRDTTGWQLRAFYVDHGLQRESAQWAEHCQSFCAALAIDCAVLRVCVADFSGCGMEAAARDARYQALREQLHDGEYLLTGHHQDDQAETVIVQLMRGSGVHGVAGMPAVACFGKGYLVRPLLSMTRTQLAEYVAAQRLNWIEDPSNTDQRYARNYVRARVMPVLHERWPDAARLLARAARHAADSAELLNEVGQVDLAGCCDVGQDSLWTVALAALSAARQRNVLRVWIRDRGLPLPSTRQLEAARALIHHRTRTQHAAVAWPGAELRRYHERLYLRVPTPAPSATWTASWDPSMELTLPELGLALRMQATHGSGLAAARLADRSLAVRLRHGGEFCRLPGRTHRSKLKKLLQAARVPPWERARLPLIYVDGDLAAVADRWVCAPYAAQAGEPGLRPSVRWLRNPPSETR